jgi:hypothetical protein
MSPKSLYHAVPAACRSSWPAAALAVIVGVMAFVLVELGSGLRPALADGDGSPGICLDPTGNHGEGGITGSVSGTADLITHSVAENAYVSGVCIKSGTNTFGGTGHSSPLGNGVYDKDGNLLPHGVPGCYAVSGVSLRELTVARINPSSECQGLSHVDVLWFVPDTPPGKAPGDATGRLTVKKECRAVNPATGKLAPLTGEGAFKFELLNGEPPFTGGLSAARTFIQFNLACGKAETLTGLQPGTYTVLETTGQTNPAIGSGKFVEKANSCVGIEVEPGKTAKCEIVNEKTSGTPASSATPAAGAASSTSVTPPSTGDGGILDSGSWAQRLLWLGPLLALGTGGGGYLLARALRRP